MFRFRTIKHFKRLSESNHKMISRKIYSSEIDKPHIPQNVNSFINQGLPLLLNNKQINKIFLYASDLQSKRCRAVVEITYVQDKEIKLRYEDDNLHNIIKKVNEDLKKGNL